MPTSPLNMKNASILGFIAIASVLVVGAVAWKYVSLSSSPVSVSSRYPVDETYFDRLNEEAPVTKFDASVVVPNTNIRVAYPKKGFYDGGIKIENVQRAMASSRELIEGIWFGPILKDGIEKGERPILTVQMDKMMKENETLEEVGEELTSWEGERDLKNGFYKTVNGRRWLFVPQFSDTWNAFTIEKDSVIHAALIYAGVRDIQVATERNGKLFLQILEQVKFE